VDVFHKTFNAVLSVGLVRSYLYCLSKLDNKRTNFEELPYVKFYSLLLFKYGKQRKSSTALYGLKS